MADAIELDGEENVNQARTTLGMTCILGLTLGFLAGCGGSSSSSAPSGPTPATIIANIPLGKSSVAVAVNPVTNRIYVANMNDTPGTVSVIDGASNTVISTVTVGSSPMAVAVNSTSNKIYVANSGDTTVTVVDGDTNSATSVQVGNAPEAIAVNSTTNKIYVSNFRDATVSVIDGATNNTVTVPLSPPTASSVVVNEQTNKIYILNEQNSSVTVLDGATNQTTVVPVGGIALGIAVDSMRNKIYVTCVTVTTSEVDIIDGATLNVTAADVNNPDAISGFIALDATTNNIYVAHQNAVAVMDGATLAVSTLTPQLAQFIAVDPGNNQIYLLGDATVTVVDGASNATTLLNLNSDSGGALLAAVNLVTHRVYVSIECTSSVTCRYPTPGAVAVIEAAH